MYVGRHFMLSAHKHCYCRYANTYTQYTYYVHTNIKYTDTHYTENISFTIYYIQITMRVTCMDTCIPNGNKYNIIA